VGGAERWEEGGGGRYLPGVVDLDRNVTPII